MLAGVPVHGEVHEVRGEPPATYSRVTHYAAGHFLRRVAPTAKPSL